MKGPLRRVLQAFYEPEKSTLFWELQLSCGDIVLRPRNLGDFDPPMTARCEWWCAKRVQLYGANIGFSPILKDKRVIRKENDPLAPLGVKDEA